MSLTRVSGVDSQLFLKEVAAMEECRNFPPKDPSIVGFMTSPFRLLVCQGSLLVEDYWVLSLVPLIYSSF